MESEPSLVNQNQNSQQSSNRKIQIGTSSNQNSSMMIERTRSEPIPNESTELVRTPSTFVHVDSAEFQEDRIKKELSSSVDVKEEKSSEYDAPITDISDAKV